MATTQTLANATNAPSSDFAPTAAIHVLVVVVSLTAIASVLGNFLVQVAFWRTKNLKASPPGVLVMALAFVDFCMAIFVMPFVVITALHDRWYPSHKLCVASGFMNTLLTAIQFGVLFSISINRFLAVSNPHQYHLKWTIKLTYSMVAIVFGHSLFWSLLPFVGWGGYDYTPGTLFCNINWSEHKAHSSTLFVCCYILPALIGAILYVVVYVKIRNIAKSSIANMRGSQKDVRAMKVEKDYDSYSDVYVKNAVSVSKFTMDMKGRKMYESNTSIHSVNQQRRYRSTESRVTKSLLLVAVAFAIFWLPRGLVNLWAVVSGRHTVPKALEYVTTVFIFMNSFVNPIIYGVFHHEYNRAFRHLLRCQNRCASGARV